MSHVILGILPLNREVGTMSTPTLQIYKLRPREVYIASRFEIQIEV